MFARHVWEPTDVTIKDAMRQRLPAVVKKPWLEHSRAQIKGVRLVGEPDVVRLQKKRGRLVPSIIDIKSHKKLQFTDQIQVTVYSFILSKMLATKRMPKSYIRLLREGEEIEKPEDLDKYLCEVDVESRFIELENLVNDIVQHFEDPNLISIRDVNCIGPKAQEILKAEGILTLKELARVDDWLLLRRLKKKYLSRGQLKGLATTFAALYKFEGKDNIIRRWKFGAKALLRNQIVIFNRRPMPARKEGVYFDLEYDPVGQFQKQSGKNTKRIWLASLLISKGARRELHQFFAASSGEEGRLLQSILPYLCSENSLIYTYSGTSADFPMLKDALGRHGLDTSVVRDIKENRHVDLLLFLRDTISLPLTPGNSIPKQCYGLKNVEKFFSIPRKLEMDGSEALMMYQQVLEAKSSKNRKAEVHIKKTLMAYGAEDVENLLGLKRKLSKVMRNN